MSSMTDIIFLLLVFFMLTSSFITPSGLPVNLPSSKTSRTEMQKISITITKDLEYFVNDKRISRSNLEAELRTKLQEGKGTVALHIDEDVPTKEMAYAGGVAASLEAKVTLVTKPN